jgi:hypothetical protein
MLRKCGRRIAVTMRTIQDSNQSPQSYPQQLPHPSRGQLLRNNLNTIIRVISPHGGDGWLPSDRPKAGQLTAAAGLRHPSQLQYSTSGHHSIWRGLRLHLLMVKTLIQRGKFNSGDPYSLELPGYNTMSNNYVVLDRHTHNTFTGTTILL